MRSFSDICDASIKKWIKSFISDSTITASIPRQQNLSAQAQQLVELAFSDIRLEKLVDYHVHLIGMVNYVSLLQSE